MSTAIAYSRALRGIDAPQVCVEAHISAGLPRFDIVGLAEAEVREARDRVRSAILNSGFEFPARRMIINLAPADLPKDSGRFDLAIAMAILVASGQISDEWMDDYEWIGELSLFGDVRKVRGILPMALRVQQNEKKRTLVLPFDNAYEATVIENISLIPAKNLKEVVMTLEAHILHIPYTHTLPIVEPVYEDLLDVKAQFQARKALEIAAAGGHSMLMMGPPGSGKSMLARRLVGILPAMTEMESLESASIYSLNGMLTQQQWRKRPFRSPHHTASAVALVGGSSSPKPGEISLAHHGILFLDELPEFDRRVLEVLREPLETGEITISRAGQQAHFPASFQLVTAMNPCPCGYFGHKNIACRCTNDQIKRYQGRISGPLLDRIDIQIDVPVIEHDALLDGKPGESSSSVRQRVEVARQRQIARQNKPNARLSSSEVDTYCVLDDASLALIKKTMEQLSWSARACHRALKLARTIADLADCDAIQMAHIAQAIQYRRALKNNV